METVRGVPIETWAVEATIGFLCLLGIVVSRFGLSNLIGPFLCHGTGETVSLHRKRHRLWSRTGKHGHPGTHACRRGRLTIDLTVRMKRPGTAHLWRRTLPTGHAPQFAETRRGKNDQLIAAANQTMCYPKECARL